MRKPSTINDDNHNYNKKNKNITDNRTSSSVMTTMSNCTNKYSEVIPCYKNSIYGQYLPPTDSRYRPDVRLFELGHIDEAAAEKLRLEEKQRHRRKSLNGQRKIPQFNWSKSANNHNHNHTTMTNSTIKPFFTNNLFKKAFSSNSTTTTTSTSHCFTDNDKNLHNSNNTTVKSDLSSNNNNQNQIIGPLWFILSINPFTKQEEWQITGDYWKRDWSQCPDLY
ncbi:unnamed protein product [Schistosoma turkestanicum]|nr:unnamed protein product [Schistosoma turkestanicum]